MLTIYQNPPELDSFIRTVGDSGAIMLIFAGIMAFVWFLSEGYRRGGFLRPKKEEALHDELSTIFKIIVFLGIFIGLLVIATGIITIWLDIPPSENYAVNRPHYDMLTSVSLILMGFAMFLKPFKDVPWAALLGIIGGCALGVYVCLAIPENWLIALELLGNWNSRYVYVVVFIVIASAFGVFIKFWFNGIEMVSRFISWPPIALIIAIYCLIQGFYVLIGGNTLWLIVLPQ